MFAAGEVGDVFTGSGAVFGPGPLDREGTRGMSALTTASFPTGADAVPLVVWRVSSLRPRSGFAAEDGRRFAAALFAFSFDDRLEASVRAGGSGPVVGVSLGRLTSSTLDLAVPITRRLSVAF